MVLRPDDIEQREFGSALRGFDKAEVRAFLRRVAGEVRYLESEVEAVRGSAAGVTSDRPAVDLELPRVDTRPAPPALAPRTDDLPPRDLPDLGAPGSQLPEPTAVAPAALSSSPSPEHEADRFGALGDRIADLLRNAQETAEQVRRQADSDAAQTRAEAAAAGVELRTSADHYATQTREAASAAADDLRSSADAYSTEIRGAAEADAAALRTSAEEALASAQAEAAEVREHALADANEMRTRAAEELESSRSEAAAAVAQAEADVSTLRQKAIDDGVASLEGREATVAHLEAEVAAEREQALAELADARGQVSTLLQEARAQSEFIRQESEEIIRTKVRANMEQAQRRIDMLRTTETASKDRIAAARKELESALARLDAEPAPGLPAGTEDLVLEEAQQAAAGTEGLAFSSDPSIAPSSPDQMLTEAARPNEFLIDDDLGSGIIDVDTVATTDDPTVDESGVEDLSAEAVIDSFGLARSEGSDEASGHEGAFDLVEAIDTIDDVRTDADELDDTRPDEAAALVDLPAPETDTPPPPPPPPPAGFGDDDFVDPGVGQTVHGGSFFAPRGSDSTDEPPPPPPPPGFDAPVGIDAPVFDAANADAVSAADSGSTLPEGEIDPLEGLIPAEHEDASSTDPARGETATPGDQVSFGEPANQEAVADVNTPENEDALAKLVREAMQRAVDSARGNQN